MSVDCVGETNKTWVTAVYVGSSDIVSGISLASVSIIYLLQRLRSSLADVKIVADFDRRLKFERTKSK
jgi:hypothetical protein